ncbi:co-chaperone protein DjlA [Thalassotalea insulae]|uniref:Co-chaperone protein DjlA n=1 Tax=Thalassotalea insulae TaxID=2056778 RepID=A0ABQ6GT86_9GAMM|nr:co-chaperone DjlA [Thalassotalea insulae]GLX79138.1 co-chaperone protein DjlA [Thalassotalea insulae]
MKVWGKVFGFLFGLMLSKSIFGALLGLWLGHRFDKGLGLNFDEFAQLSEENRQSAFFNCTFTTMGFIAKANGRVSQHEIAFASAYMDKLGLNTQMRQQAQDAFREGKMAGFPLEQHLKKFKRICINRQDLLLLFLEIQIQVAFADGQLDNEERNALHRIARILGFSAVELDRLLEMIIAGANFHQQGESNRKAGSPQQLENAYKLLGVTSGDPEKVIKKAYRKLMAQHHPDKLVAKGLPPEMMEVAKQKAQDIQAAYEMIQAQNKS